MKKLNSGANKSIWAILVGAAISVVRSFVPDLMPEDVWNTVHTALVAAAIYFIPNKTA